MKDILKGRSYKFKASSGYFDLLYLGYSRYLRGDGIKLVGFTVNKKNPCEFVSETSASIYFDKRTIKRLHKNLGKLIKGMSK